MLRLLYVLRINLAAFAIFAPAMLANLNKNPQRSEDKNDYKPQINY